MAFSDWTVEILDVVARPNAATNPYTGLPIDPDGITQSLFSMRLTHVPTGKVLERADLTNTVTPEILTAYARGIAANAETHLAFQSKEGAASPLIGALDITVPVAPGPSDDDLAVVAFRGLVKDLQQAKARLAVKQGTQQDVDAAELAVKTAYAPKGVAISPELAKRFDEVLASLVNTATAAL